MSQITNNKSLFTLLLCLFFMSGSFDEAMACKFAKNTNLSEDERDRRAKVSDIIWRAQGFVLNKKDHEYLALLLAQNYALLPDFDAKVHSTTSLFLKVVKTSNFDVTFLEGVLHWSSERTGLVSTKVKRTLDELIWWANARLMAHVGEFDLLKNHADSESEIEAVLSILSERGEVQFLQEWLEKGGFSKSRMKKRGLKFGLAIRKAKLVNALNQPTSGYGDALIVEFKQSVIGVFPGITKGGYVNHKHLQWLFKVMGKHRHLPEVGDLLERLIEAPLAYHQAQLYESYENMPDLDAELSIDVWTSTVNERLNIHVMATEALNPQNPNSSAHYYGCSG